MANIQALAQLNLNTRELETVRDVRAFMERDTPKKAGDKPTWPIKIEVPGQALAGHGEYRSMLQDEFDEILPVLNQKILNWLRQREIDAKDQIKKAAERL
jgi:hypothetical protein